MGALLESGRVGNVSLNHLKTVRQDVINRWDSLGLLEGLTGHRKENIAQLYENQASWMLNESTTLGAEGSFETVVFPIVRRVFSKLLANEIVSVQALNLPIGKLFYFVPKIGESMFDSTNATKAYPSTQGYGLGTGRTGGNNMMGMVSGNDFSDNVNLYDGFYGEDGYYDKSKGKAAVLTATATTSGYTFSTTDASGFAIANQTGITSGNTGIIKFTFNPGNGFDWENIEDFMSSMDVKILGNTADFYFPTQKYGNQLMNSSGEVYVAIPNTGTTTIAITATGITATAKQYASLELADDMGEVSFELKSVTVSVTERKLRAQWSPELAQDVSAFHNIDAEAELTALLSEQVAAEIDREILKDLRRGAAWRLYWDYKGTTNRGIDVNTAGAFYTQKEWNQTLVTAINQVSAQIHKATLRGGANFIVCSAEVSAIFDDLEYFHVSNASPEQDKYNMGIERVGALAGRYQVYRDPYFPADTILIGHKGTSLLDTGYIYAPYVPLQLTPTMYNPFTFAPVKGIMTRYAKKMVNNRFYGVVKVQNVVTFATNSFR
jgi:hypothetical protein